MKAQREQAVLSRFKILSSDMVNLGYAGHFENYSKAGYSVWLHPFFNLVLFPEYLVSNKM